jgi:two-component system invasion response regulator UvrY
MQTIGSELRVRATDPHQARRYNGSSAPVRILIGDDHEILRKGLREILAHELPDSLFGEARNSEEVLEAVRTRLWDVIILDITMPGRSGLDILKDLRLIDPRPPALVLSMHPESQLGKRALKLGAAGYLNKDSAPEELITALQKILSGGRYVSATLAQQLALDLSSDGDRLPHERLSDREMEVLRMIASGKTVSQIAVDLHLRATTVSTHRARILKKMKMASTAQLMHYWLSNHLFEG